MTVLPPAPSPLLFALAKEKLMWNVTLIARREPTAYFSMDNHVLSSRDIEDITWPCGDTKFRFSWWKIFHEWALQTSEIISTREEKFRISKRSSNFLFYYINPHNTTKNSLFFISRSVQLTTWKAQGHLYICINRKQGGVNSIQIKNRRKARNKI